MEKFDLFPLNLWTNQQFWVKIFERGDGTMESEKGTGTLNERSGNMLFIVGTGRDEKDFCERTDRHIWNDTELELPDFGKFKQYTKGLHFTRKGRTLKGIYRLNDYNEWEATVRRRRYSIHVHFFGRAFFRKDGKGTFVFIAVPQISFWFLLAACSLLTAAFLYKQDIEKTGMLAGLFGMGLAVTVLDQLLLEFRLLKEFRNFFRRRKG